MLQKFVLVTLISITLCACGGGGNTSSTNSTDPGTVSQASTSGIWVGTYTTLGHTQFPSVVLITSSGVVGIDLGNGVFFVGSSSVSNGELSITGNESESTNAIITIGVTLTPQQKLSMQVLNGAYAVKTGDAIDCTYDSVYEKGSSIGKLVATWTARQSFAHSSPLDWTINILQDGTFSGMANDFKVNGTFSLIDSKKNEYVVTMTANKPGAPYVMNGNYTGIATILDTNGTDNTLLMFFKGDQEFKVIERLKLQRRL